MRENSSDQKASQSNLQNSKQSPSAGPDGLAIAPPDYALNSVATIQRKEDASGSGDGQANPSPNRTGLPNALKAGVEGLSGLAMDDVRVHTNSSKPAQLQALAYTQGTDIHVAPGQERHIPHEAWHVVQQKQGRVKPTMQMKGVSVNDNTGLEAEADKMGAKAARARTSSAAPRLKSSNLPARTIQRQNFTRQFSNNGLRPIVQRQKDLEVNQEVRVSEECDENAKVAGLRGVIKAVKGNKYEVEFKTYGSQEIDEKWITPAPAKIAKLEKDPTEIMADIISEAQNFAANIQANLDSKEIAKQCIKKMEELNDKAMQQMEGKEAALKYSAKIKRAAIEKIVTNTISKVLASNEEKKKTDAMSDLAGDLIAGQRFREGNNRGTYIMLVMLGTILNVPIPDVDTALKRKKIEFEVEKISDQFKVMYTQMQNNE